MFQLSDFLNTKSDEDPWIEPFQVQWNLSNNETIGTKIIALILISNIELDSVKCLDLPGVLVS